MDHKHLNIEEIIKVLEDKQNIISIDSVKTPSFIYDATRAQLMQYNSLGVSGGGL
jgi:hypothetical protein